MASRRSSWGGAMETYWAAPAAARDHVAALDRPSTVCVPVKSARAARGGGQHQGDHEASITPIARCQPDFGRQSMVGWTDCPWPWGSTCYAVLVVLGMVVELLAQADKPRLTST